MKLPLFRLPPWARTKCPHCEGNKTVEISYGMGVTNQEDCPICEGKGYVMNEDVAVTLTFLLLCILGFAVSIALVQIAVNNLEASAKVQEVSQ